MNFKVKINNIGKLKDVEISLKPFTILAGPNNTGKSFISKTLYSVLSLTRNPLLTYMQDQLEPIKETLNNLQEEYLNKYNSYYHEQQKNQDLKKILRNQIEDSISSMRKLTNVVNEFNRLENISNFDKKINESLNPIIKSFNDILPFFSTQLEKIIKSSKKSLSADTIKKIKELYVLNKKILKTNIDLLNMIKKEPLEKKITKGVIKIIEDNLKGNFQISDLSKLLGNFDKPVADISLQNNRKNKENEIKMSLLKKNIQYNSSIFKLTENSFQTIYLESPFYWKLRKALTRANRPFFSTARRSLLTPKYFRDLNIMLGEELTGEPAFPELLKMLNQDTIKGKIFEDETGTLKFKETNGGAYSLPSTATGIVQLGILALLIEKKALDKGTILFIDEPEVNLHPAWQVKMMEILFELASQGAFVVMATHSVDMLKWLEVHLQKNPEKKSLVALNQMILQKDGSATNVKQKNKSFLKSEKLATDAKTEDDIQNQIRAIKENLTDSYLEMYLEGEE